MGYERTENELNVTLERDMTVLTGRHIERLAQDVDRVHIDCSAANLIDSEGVIVLYRLVRDGKTVTLRNPPEIFYEVLDILDLDTFFDLDAMVE